MLRRLAVLVMAALPLLAACGQQPILNVGLKQITVQPNAGSDQEEMNVPYTVGARAHVTVSLVQPNGQTMQLRDNDRDPDSYAFPFGGVVDVPNTTDRRVLQNGAYKLVFTAKTPNGTTVEQTVDALVKNADPVALDITGVALSLDSFSPNGQGTREVNGQQLNLDQTTFNYSVSKDTSVAMWVVDTAGGITPVQAPFDAKAGLQTFTWDGKGPNGIALKDGPYTYHIQAKDTSGNVTEKTGQLTIQNSGTPQLQVVSAVFSPTALGLGGTVNIEITVKNTGDVAILTQGPQPGTKYTTQMSYLDPSFNHPGDQIPPYVDKAGRWRVVVRWTSAGGQYPARWGFFADDSQSLQPGQQVTVKGSIQIQPPQPHDIDFWASVEMGGLGFTGDYGQQRIHIGF